MAFVVPVGMFLLTRIFTTGDKTEDKTAAVAKQVAELALQISSLRTELAQQELARARDMDARFVLRREFDQHAQLVEFTRKLTLETHKRLHPEAAIHEPGGMSL